MAQPSMHHLRRRPDEPGGTYYIDASIKGKRIRQSLETSILREAKQRRDDILAGKIEARWGKPDIDIPLQDFWKAYEPYAEMHKSKSGISREHTNWNQFLEFMGSAMFGDVTEKDVDAFKAHLKKHRKQSNRTINDSCGRIQSLFNYARKLELYSGDNPFEGFSRLPVEKKPVKFLSKDEINALLIEAEKYGQDIFMFCSLCLYAGLRSNEAANTRWEWFDFDQGVITVQPASDNSFSTKNRSHRAIPLHNRLRDILEPLKQSKGFLILPEKTEPGKWRTRYEAKKAFIKVKTAAGVEWCTPHIMRHTFASQLVMAGISLFKVSRWLGHSDTKVTQIYSHLSPSDTDINAF